MKKILLILAILGFLISGCASIQDSEFAKHSYSFKSEEHMWFSLDGYRNPTDETAKKSKEEGWWGVPIE